MVRCAEQHQATHATSVGGRHELKHLPSSVVIFVVLKFREPQLSGSQTTLILYSGNYGYGSRYAIVAEDHKATEILTFEVTEPRYQRWKYTEPNVEVHDEAKPMTRSIGLQRLPSSLLTLNRVDQVLATQSSRIPHQDRPITS